MYIGSTNISFDLSDYKSDITPSWITSEKYYNCENFYSHSKVNHNKFRLFRKRKEVKAI